MKVYNIDKFAYDPRTKTFTAEASGFGPDFNHRGFDIAGEVRTVAFYLDKTVWDDEGDVVAWQYSGHDGSRGHFFATVFND